MNFSLWSFKEWFDREGIELSYMISQTSAEISALGSSPASSGDSVKRALVYSGELLTDCSGFHSVLQYGNDRILFPTASPAEVWNMGNEMIEQLSGWEASLLNSIQNCHSLLDLFQTAQKEFPFPLALLLKNGTVFQKTSDWNLQLDEKGREDILKHVIPAGSSEPVCRTFLYNPLQTYIAGPVMVGGSPSAILVSYNGERRFQPGIFPVFQTVADAVRTYFKYYSETPLTTHPLSGWFYQILNPDERSFHDLPARLSAAGWRRTDYYQIACIEAKPGSLPSVLPDAAALLYDPSNCCIMINGRLAVLRNLGNVYPSRIREFGTSVLSAGDCRIGLSLLFRSLDLTSAFYSQAVWAVRKAARSNEDCCDAASHLSEYLRELCRELPGSQPLVHPDILRLAEADASRSDELLKTLYAYYIEGHSISGAADMLFIHRNTLRLRLNKIRALLSADPDDPQAEKQYLLSLLLCRT